MPQHPLSKHQWLVNEAAIAAMTHTDAGHKSTIDTAELEQVYKVFLFYDSSFHGDRLPSISLGRFLEVLRDTHMLAANFTEIHAEEVFAQAILGKLRTYLDADGAPALTFKLFCGALMQIATVKFPGISPSLAMRKLVRRHLFAVFNEIIVNPDGSSRRRSISTALTDAYWRPTEARGEAKAQCRRVSRVVYDKVVRQIVPPPPHVVTESDIPDELRQHFCKAHYELIVRRFQVFDHKESGLLDHEDMFVFVHGLAETIPISDVQHATERLTSFPSNRVTLPFLFKVLANHVPRDPNAPPLPHDDEGSAGDDAPTTLALPALVPAESASPRTPHDTLLGCSLHAPEEHWDAAIEVFPLTCRAGRSEEGAPHDELASVNVETILPGRFDAKTIDSVIQRITITSTSEKKQRNKKQAPPQQPRIVLTIDETSGTTKFWEGRIRGCRLIECAGILHGTEQRVITEANTRMESEESCQLLLHHRVHARLKAGYKVVEGRRFLPDDAKAPKPLVVATKKGSLDRGSTVVRSMPQLPTYTVRNHHALYNTPSYELPEEWQPPATHLPPDLSWVKESFPLRHPRTTQIVRNERVQGHAYQRGMCPPKSQRLEPLLSAPTLSMSSPLFYDDQDNRCSSV
ncbi:hypothetical protein ACHHYP_02830 [Achlya hypogyna]|uniref:EF-hand domain-containing protein n=1 Tax=Achlya hypogyna TaxID=1202772 RepID=A0A1V9ZRV9_ACHHY|nr:hypothetical protein ACHHYP_02830 [Achlya hypogyna]